MQFTLKNAGDGDSAEAEYSIILTQDSVIDISADTAIYKSSVLLAAGTEEPISVSMTYITSYVSAHSVSIADGRYFIAAVIDPDAGITEGSESNNDAAGTVAVYFFNNQPMAYGIEGTVTLPVGMRYYASGQQYVLDGTYTVYIGLTTISKFVEYSGAAVSASTRMGTGSITTSQAYAQASGAMISCTIFVPVNGSYWVFAYVDRDDDGEMEYYHNGTSFVPSEPCWYEQRTIDSDLAAYAMTATLH